MSLWKVFAVPSVAALCIFGGLWGALLGSGWEDALACVVLAAPVGWCGWMLWRPRVAHDSVEPIVARSGGVSLHRSVGVVLAIAVGLALLVAVSIRVPTIHSGERAWLAATLATFAIRAPHGWRNRANQIVSSRRGRIETLLLSVLFLTIFVLPLVYLATGGFAFANYAVPRWSVTCGMLLQAPYLWLFWRSHADLGRNWSPGLELREGHGLVASGVYARIRHPMYAAVSLSGLAQPLLIPNWVAGALVLPAIAALWWIRVPREEALMRERFGTVYETYVARTGALLPRWTLRGTVRPRR